MKRIKIKYLLLVFSLILTNCGEKSTDIINSRTYNDVRADFQNLNFTTGVNDVTLLNINNFLWSFRVIMPNVNFTNNNRPLIIALHSFSGDNTDAHKATACYIEPGYESLDAIIISPNAGSFLWEDIINQEQILSLIDLAVTYLPVNLKRIVVTGYSAGANGSWFSGEVQPNVFSAAIPIASSYNTITNGNPRLIETPMYVIHGENDDFFPLNLTQNWVNQAIEAGGNITFVIAPDLNHFQPCLYVEYIQEAANWLVNDIWN
ncbi:MAG: hypothetical protein HKO01_05990 [Flaviramulus sp.]|nr:dienelactone hydrolase family protein [Flaviramulus sp.]NNC50069.1 hypothetical protein [Flaviramulus sp.]